MKQTRGRQSILAESIMTSQGQIQEMAGEKEGTQVGAVGETNQARGACVPWREGSLLEAPGRWGAALGGVRYPVYASR